MPYKKRGQRTKLLDLARKSRERAQARRAAKQAKLKEKTAAVNRANRLISGASPKTSSKSKTIRHGKTKITVNGKPSPHLRTASKKPTHGRVIPKDITGRTAKPSMVKPPTGKKVKPVQLRPKGRAGGGVPGGRKGFLGIPGLTADKYKQAQLRAKGKRLSGDLAMKIPGSMSTKTAGRIGTGLEIGGSVLMLLTPAAPIAVANFKRYAATTAGKEFLKRGGTIKKWFSTAFKGKKNPFKDLSGSKGRQQYKEPIGPSQKPTTPKPTTPKKKAAKKEPKPGEASTYGPRRDPSVEPTPIKPFKKTPAKTPVKKTAKKKTAKKTAKKTTGKKPVVKESVPPAKKYPVKEYTDAWKKQQKKKAPSKKPVAKKKAPEKQVKSMYGKENFSYKAPAKKKAAKKAVTTGRKKGGRRMMDKKKKK